MNAFKVSRINMGQVRLSKGYKSHELLEPEALLLMSPWELAWIDQQMLMKPVPP